MKDRITKKLSENLSPKYLEVTNQSGLHKGHPGDNGTMETHFEVMISSKSLNGTRIENQRKINQLLKDEFDNGLHALSIKIIDWL